MTCTVSLQHLEQLLSCHTWLLFLKLKCFNYVRHLEFTWPLFKTQLLLFKHMELTFLISLTPLCFSSSAPCAPQDVAVNAQCTDVSMVVSWSPNVEVQYFDVLAVSNTGATHHCNSSGTTCTIANLTCGQKYNVTVLSVRHGCDSNPSAVVETTSGKLS